MRTDRFFLADMLDAISVIAQYLPGDQLDFDANPPIQSHILRHIQIIGEAATRLSPELKARHPNVPWRQIAGMRNAIVHAYFQIDWKEVWNTARNDIPVLGRLLEPVLKSISSAE